MFTDKKTYYLIIDQGGHATRAIVFDEAGETICAAETAIKTITRNTLEVEHDPDELLNSVYSVIEKTIGLLGENVSKIKQVALATQRSSIVCWNRETGEALSPVISWQDRRTTHTISQYEKHLQYIHEITGLYLNPHYGASKMRWCLDNLPLVAQAHQAGKLCVAPLASFILFHLLENKPFVIDPANASRSLLMNYKTLSWQSELLDLFSVPRNILPEIVVTKKNYGRLAFKSLAAPLMLCTGDQSSAVYSDGNLAIDEVFVNAGTGAFILKANEGVPELGQNKMLASVVYADEKSIQYVIEGTVNGAGRALQWWSEQAGIIEYESNLDEWSNQYQNPPVFINAISGVGSPYWVAEFDSYFTTDADNQEKFIAVLESIVFLIAENIKSIQKASGVIRQIRLAGGLSKSNSFAQKLSNVLSVKIVKAAEAEATAKGAFYLLTGQGPENEKCCAEKFYPEKADLLNQRYKCWQNIMQQVFA